MVGERARTVALNPRTPAEEEWIDSHFKYSPHYTLPSSLPHDPTRPSFQQLPDDCIDLIFSYLSFEELVKVCSVCKRWYNACLFAFSRRPKDKLFMFVFMRNMNNKYFSGQSPWFEQIDNY